MKKKTFIGLTVSALALSLVAGAAIHLSIGKAPFMAHAAWSGSGTGTADDPYQIATRADLEKFRDICNGTNGETQNTSACAVLIADLTGENKMTEGWIVDNISSFSGTFDGNGHTIEVQTSGAHNGLFNMIQAEGVVKNIVFTGNIGTAAMVGSQGKPCASVGYLNLGTVENICNYMNIYLGSSAGGIVNSNNGTIRQCENHGTIIGTKPIYDGTSWVGGIAGYCQNPGAIIDCYNDGAIQGTLNENAYNCTGGIVGEVYYSTIKNVHNYGSVTSTGTAPFGQFCGILETTEEFLSPCDGIYTSAAQAGDFIGSNRKSTDLSLIEHKANLTAEQFKDQSNFVGFDFTNVWKMGKDYPVLAAFAPHIHELSYAASGATITATCAAEDCDLENNQATLTLEAPANLVYDGTAKAATLAEGYNTDVFPSPEIKYYQGTSEVTSCINVGTYQAKVTFGEATAAVEFSITKATPTPAEVTDRNATYGQSLSEIALPDGWAWNAPTDKVGDVGTRQHKATFTPADAANYNTVEQNVNVIVAKADPAYTVPTGLTALINKTLSTIALPAGWAWDNPNENVGSETGNKTFKATFTPADTANYNVIEHVDITVLVTEHTHDWSYTANGAVITASCGAPDCPTADGLTLTLEAPKGDLHYDGTAKAATLKEGYSADAFPNPVIKYFSGNTEVSECVNVGSYIAKVTFGNAVAMVEFEILGKTMTDPDQPSVSVEIDDAVVEDNIELRVEVRTDVAEKETAADYEKIQKMLEANEQISKVYDVKLIRTVGGVETEIQPSDIKAGLKITVRMAIPEGVDMANARILHIHSVDDMEFVNDYETQGNDLVFEIGKLSQFAFVTKSSAPAPGGDGGGNTAHGFCIGWVALILDILAALAVGLYLILKLKPFKLPRKADEFGDKVTAKEVLLTLIACGALLANFLFGLVALIVHQCPVSIVAFVLGLLLFVGIAFWYGWTRKQGKRTPLEDKIASKFKK